MMRGVVHKGKLEVFCGPMKSGKTRELLHRLDQLEYMINASYILFKPSLDTRSTFVKSRSMNAEYPCMLININDPEVMLDVVGDCDVVAIDETQFFNEDIINVVIQLRKAGKNVIVSGLDLDFRGEPFGEMHHLLALADEVTKLQAICDHPECDELAARTQRLVNGEPAHFSAPIILIEGSKILETYEARCLKHHAVPMHPRNDMLINKQLID